jgi:cullin 1
MRVTNGIPLGSPLLLPVGTVNSVQTLKDQSSKEPLRTLLVATLVAAHLPQYFAAVETLLLAKDIDHLKKLYVQIDMVDGAHEQLRDLFQTHVMVQGKLAVEKLGKEGSADPKMYISTLLDVHELYTEIVKEAFGDSTIFVVALKKAAGIFINDNSATVWCSVLHVGVCSRMLLTRTYCFGLKPACMCSNSMG